MIVHSLQKKISPIGKRGALICLIFLITSIAPISAQSVSDKIQLPYHLSSDLSYTENTFEFSADPPVTVEFNIYTENVTHYKYVSINNEKGKTYEIKGPDENARFTILVKNADSHETLLDDGYGGPYTQNSAKKFVLRDKGPYLVEISGQKVKATIDIYSQEYPKANQVTQQATISKSTTPVISPNSQRGVASPIDPNQSFSPSDFAAMGFCLIASIGVVGAINWKIRGK